jgi:hypothetical protein
MAPYGDAAFYIESFSFFLRSSTSSSFEYSNFLLSEAEAEVTLEVTVGQSVRLGVEPTVGLATR